MKLAGLQKMTLLDYPGKVAATVFFGGCNFRCPYCHNTSLLDGSWQAQAIPEAELFAFLDKRRGLLDGVCVSGGEPLMQEGLEPFLRKIKALGYLVKLDTNGSYPQMLKRLTNAGLVDYVAMDIKHAPAKYAAAAGITKNVLPAVEESVRFLLDGSIPYEFRTTVVKGMHTREDIADIGRWIRGAERYILQDFTDSGNILQPGLAGVGAAELRNFADAARAFVPGAGIRGG